MSLYKFEQFGHEGPRACKVIAGECVAESGDDVQSYGVIDGIDRLDEPAHGIGGAAAGHIELIVGAEPLAEWLAGVGVAPPFQVLRPGGDVDSDGAMESG